MQNKIELLKEKFSELVNSDFKSWKEVKNLDKICGVYSIYDDTKKIIYIGSTGNLKVRLGTDLRHYSTHILIRKLKKDRNFTDDKDAFNFISERCLFHVIRCDNKREAEAVEHFAIWILDPPLNKL